MIDEQFLVRVHTERGVQLGLRRGFGAGDTVDVFLPTSGSVVSVPRSRVSPPSSDDVRQYGDQLQMLEVLRGVEEEIVAERRSTANAALVSRMLSLAEARGYTSQEIGSFHRVQSRIGSRCLYLSKNGRRVDMTDFCVLHPLVSSIDESEARSRRLGRVRGQALGVEPDQLEGLWLECLDSLL